MQALLVLANLQFRSIPLSMTGEAFRWHAHRRPAVLFATVATNPDDPRYPHTSATRGSRRAEMTHLNMRSTDGCRPSGCRIARLKRRHDTAITLPLCMRPRRLRRCPLSPPGAQSVLRDSIRQRCSRDGCESTTHDGVPTMYWTLLKHARDQNIDVSRTAATLRLAVSGGAPMPVELMRDFEKAFGVRIIEGYGLSETSPVASFNHLDRPSKPGTVGQPLFAVEIMIVNDKDEQVETGQPGEVVIRGHNVMKGYYKQPEATAQAMRNGWLHTGDIGMFDADGYLSIVDRKKDMILRGASVCFPASRRGYPDAPGCRSSR